MLEWSLACEQGACVSQCQKAERSWHIANARKKPYHGLDFYIQDWCWIGSVINSYRCDLVSLDWFLSGNIFLVWDILPAEVVTSPPRSVSTTSELASSGCHLTGLASDLGQACRKYICTVPFYGAYAISYYLLKWCNIEINCLNVILLIYPPPPPKVFRQIIWVLFFCLICHTPIVNWVLSVNPQPFSTSW